MTVSVAAAWLALMSHLTLEPDAVRVAKWFLSSLDWANAEMLKQASTKTILNTEGILFLFIEKAFPF